MDGASGSFGEDAIRLRLNVLSLPAFAVSAVGFRATGRIRASRKCGCRVGFARARNRSQALSCNARSHGLAKFGIRIRGVPLTELELEATRAKGHRPGQPLILYAERAAAGLRPSALDLQPAFRRGRKLGQQNRRGAGHRGIPGRIRHRSRPTDLDCRGPALFRAPTRAPLPLPAPCRPQPFRLSGPCPRSGRGTRCHCP